MLGCSIYRASGQNCAINLQLLEGENLVRKVEEEIDRHQEITQMNST